MYHAHVDRARFLAEVRAHKRIPRVRVLPDVSIGAKPGGYVVSYTVAAYAGTNGKERMLMTYAELIQAKRTDRGGRLIEPRWEIDWSGTVLEQLRAEQLEYEVAS